jgi:hypothetical protein
MGSPCTRRNAERDENQVVSEQFFGPSLSVIALGHAQPIPILQQVVMMYVRYPLSLRNVEDLLAERGIDISHETVRFWWNRFGPMFAAEIRKKRVAHLRRFPQWRWHLDESIGSSPTRKQANTKGSAG